MITLNKDRKQTKYGHKRQEHMTHTTEPWHNSPLPEGVSHAVTVPPGRGAGRSGGPSGQTRTGPQDGDLQSGTDDGGHGGAGSSGGHGGAGSSGGHGGAGSSGGHGRWSFMAVASSLGQATPAGTLGKLGGIRSPPGLDKQDSTWHDRRTLQGQTNRTGHPTGTGSPPGRARKLRLPLGMTGSQGPSQGPSATASTSATGGQAAGMASMATTRGQPPAPDESPRTRQDKTD